MMWDIRGEPAATATIRLGADCPELPLDPDQPFYLDRVALDPGSATISRRPRCLQVGHEHGTWVLMNRSRHHQAWLLVPGGTREVVSPLSDRVLPPGRSQVFIKGTTERCVVVAVPDWGDDNQPTQSEPTLAEPHLLLPNADAVAAVRRVLSNQNRKMVLAAMFGLWLTGGTSEPRSLSREETADCVGVSKVYVDDTLTRLRKALGVDGTVPRHRLAQWLAALGLLDSTDVAALRHVNCNRPDRAQQCPLKPQP